MKPETAAFLRKSQEFLAKSQEFLDIGRWPEEAGRAAYLAGFHAAQALLFENTGKAFKFHNGVQKEFHRLTKPLGLDRDLRAFLGRSYNFKAIADYETRSDIQISADRAHNSATVRGMCGRLGFEERSISNPICRAFPIHVNRRFDMCGAPAAAA